MVVSGVLVLLERGDVVPGPLAVQVPELDFRHRRVDPEDLVLNALTTLDGEPQDLLDLLAGGIAVWVEDLHQAGEGLVDPVTVAGRDVGRQREVVLVTVGVVLRAHRLEHLGDVIDDEPVAVGEHLAADDVDFPAGDVVVQAVEVGGVVVGLGQLVEQVGVLEHVRHGVRGVADEDHRGFGTERLDTAGERLVRHVVLHDVHERSVGALLLAGELVEGDDVPVPDQADASVGVVDEKLRDGDLAAGDEHPVGRELREDVGLAGALWAELDQVVVALDERDEAHELEELAATAEQSRG